MVVRYSEQKSFKIAEFRLSWTELPVLEGRMSELAVIKFSYGLAKQRAQSISLEKAFFRLLALLRANAPMLLMDVPVWLSSPSCAPEMQYEHLILGQNPTSARLYNHEGMLWEMTASKPLLLKPS